MKVTSSVSPAFPPAGNAIPGSRKLSDVQSITTIFIPAVRRLANNHEVVPVGGDLDTDEPVLFELGRVVRDSKLKSILVQNGNERIEHRAQSNRFDLDRQSLVLFGSNNEVVHVFVQDDAIDRSIQLDFLGGLDRVVGFCLGLLRERTDVKRAVIRDSGAGANLGQVFTQATVGSNLDSDIDIVGVERLNLRDFDACVIQEDFFRVVQPGAGEFERVLAAALDSTGQNQRQAG